MLVGAGILSIIFAVDKDEAATNRTDHQYRRFSDTEIRLMYGAFTAVTVLANIIFFVIPTREIEHCIEGREQTKKSNFKQQMSESPLG